MKWKLGIAILFFFALVAGLQYGVFFTVNNYDDVVNGVKRVTGLEEEVLVPDPDVAAGVEFEGTESDPIPTPRSVPRSELTMYDLQVLALSYINEDRAKFGLDPVTLDDNPAAQSHAEDMKTGLYLGHWWRDGKKPYMVYTETGGTSYVSENVARSGFTAEEYGKYCSSATVRCQQVDPVEDMKRLHYSMMYDDASSNWGHRENILNPAHRKVSIGIAYFDHFFAFVQHFEGGTVTADSRPTVTNGVMTVDATINEPGFDLFSVATIHYEPLPQPRTPGEIEELHAYCIGGGFSEECGTDVIRIIPPPPRGQRYTGLDAKTVVADDWTVSGRDIEITADLGSLVARPGVYTLTLYADGEGNFSGETALQLTLAFE